MCHRPLAGLTAGDSRLLGLLLRPKRSGRETVPCAIPSGHQRAVASGEGGSFSSQDAVFALCIALAFDTSGCTPQTTSEGCLSGCRFRFERLGVVTCSDCLAVPLVVQSHADPGFGQFFRGPTEPPDTISEYLP